MISLDALLQRLNPFQRRAVLDESSATLVNASVGSGKTTVLIAKALYEHAAHGVPLGDMVVLTFTNKAAAEIRERMAEWDPQAGDGEMRWFGTFHGVALRMLQALLPVREAGYAPSFTVMDREEEVDLAKRLVEEHGLSVRYPNKLEKRLDALAAGRVLYGAMRREDDIARLRDILSLEKTRQNRMGFDDLIANAVQLFPRSPWFPRWIIVDEFQDCDEMQLDLLRAMASPATRLFVVGDPNQAIYSWRGGSRDIFRRFLREFQAAELSLPLNYRSSSTILEAAKCFLGGHSGLEGTREPGAGIVIRNHYNPFLEGEYLADRIAGMRGAGASWRDFAVLYRMQRQSKCLEEAFKRRGIPFSVSVRRTFRDNPVLQRLIHILKASVNPDDRGSLLLAAGDVLPGEWPGGKGGKKTLECRDLHDRIRGFSRWAAEGGRPRGIYGYFGLDDYLSPASPSFREDRSLVLSFLERLEILVGGGGPVFPERLAQFLNSSALYGADVIASAPLPDEDSVRLMTLHACKGLEFPFVFIVGVNNGLIPLRTASPGARDREEEKRLFFVGVTRARDYLELSFYTSPDDPRVLPGAGEYLSMIPGHLLDRQDDAPPWSGAYLRAYRRMILENRERRLQGAFFAEGREIPPASGTGKRAVHPRYGEGMVIGEDEDSFTVAFQDYGEKIFSKDFCPLKFL